MAKTILKGPVKEKKRVTEKEKGIQHTGLGQDWNLAPMREAGWRCIAETSSLVSSTTIKGLS